jgi:hypothetical protein
MRCMLDFCVRMRLQHDSLPFQGFPTRHYLSAASVVAMTCRAIGYASNYEEKGPQPRAFCHLCITHQG